MMMVIMIPILTMEKLIGLRMLVVHILTQYKHRYGFKL